jgi:ABC-type transport system involved in cytochrome c biogenesis permease subunit
MRLYLQIFEILLPFFYFSTIWVYAKIFFRSNKLAERLAPYFLYATLLSHACYIIIRTLEYSHPPITTIFEILSLIAFAVIFSYSYIEIRTRSKMTGYFILMLPFFFQTISSIFIKELTVIPPILRSYLLGFHVTSALLGYAAITISGVYGFLYLMLYHDIKSSHFSVIYKRLPNLEILEGMSFTATVLGFILLTIAIIVGLIWMPQAVEKFSYADPKLIGTIAIWIVYAIGLAAKKIIGWQGRRIMVLSLIGFAVTMFSMTIINMFFSGFHKFY